MKNVLIVDDEKPFLLSVADGFGAYAGDFNIFTAENGRAAAELLQKVSVDLVVTDLKMPGMDGFELMAYMSRKFPAVPVIVITAYATAQIEEKLQTLGVTRYLEKPLDFDVLVDKIFEELSGADKGYIQGISLPAFLQLVEMEQKTYTLIIRSRGKIGYLHFQKGALMEAETKTQRGEEAVYDILTWEPAEIEIEGFCKQKQKKIDSTLMHILMESARLKDEARRDHPERRDSGGIKEIPNGGKHSSPSTKNPEPKAPTTQEENVMAVQDKLKELAAVEGFEGVGIFTPAGESLALMAANGKVNLKDIGVLANNVLMNAQKASLDMGTGRGQLVHVEAEKAHIIVRCLNEGTDPLKSQPGKAHIHLVLILNSESSIGLAKLKVEKVIGTLAEDFRI